MGTALCSGSSCAGLHSLCLTFWNLWNLVLCVFSHCSSPKLTQELAFGCKHFVPRLFALDVECSSSQQGTYHRAQHHVHRPTSACARLIRGPAPASSCQAVQPRSSEDLSVRCRLTFRLMSCIPHVKTQSEFRGSHASFACPGQCREVCISRTPLRALALQHDPYARLQDALARYRTGEPEAIGLFLCVGGLWWVSLQ